MSIVQDINGNRLFRLGCIVLLMAAFPLLSHSQSVEEYASILRHIGERPYRTWGIKDFKPDVIFVDTGKNEMQIFTFRADTLVSETESWDHKIMPANSATTYNGKRYITINCLSYNNRGTFLDKVKLLAHESFHYYQEELGYGAATSDNYHLDLGEGRILLRCELNALQRALSGEEQALADALRLRYYRQSAFPNNERTFELNEGLAEYTGLVYTYTEEADIRERLLASIKNNAQQGYSNSFAYVTGPIYAFFTRQADPEWNKKRITDIAEDLASRYGIERDAVRQAEADSLKRLYGYEEIAREESRISGLVDQYASLWKEGKLITIPNNEINLFFNPNDRVTELNDSIVCLINVEMSGKWGRLKASNGVLRSKDWSSFFIPEPTSIQEEKITGPDYELYLNPGYKIAGGMITGQ